MSKNLRTDFAAARNKGWSAVCNNPTAITGGISNDGHSPLRAPLMAKSPVTYSGGAATMADQLLVEQAGRGLVGVTVGSALDIFGGKGLCYKELVARNGRLA